jgi:hypothetical protein
MARRWTRAPNVTVAVITTSSISNLIKFVWCLVAISWKTRERLFPKIVHNQVRTENIGFFATEVPFKLNVSSLHLWVLNKPRETSMTKEMARALADAGYITVAEYLVIVAEIEAKSKEKS